MNPVEESWESTKDFFACLGVAGLLGGICLLIYFGLKLVFR